MNQTQKHTTGKKLLALLLALIMSVSLLPMSVFAADLEQTDVVDQPGVEQGVDDAALDESSGEEDTTVPEEPVEDVQEPADAEPVDEADTQAAEGIAVQATKPTAPADGTTKEQPFKEGTGGSQNFRIPALVTLSDGTLVAAADARWNTSFDGYGLDTIVSYSSDNGKNWNYTFANYLGDNGNSYNTKSTAFIDPALAVDSKDTIYMLVDLFPTGCYIGNITTGTGYKNGKLQLSNGAYYLDGGKIYDSSKTNETIDDDNNVYTVDGKFNLYKNGSYVTNLFFLDSPYSVVKTSYLYLTKSTDGGATWSDPIMLNSQVKNDTESFYGVGPGRGLVTKLANGTERIIFPCYTYSGGTTRTSVIYSDDGGNTWTRSASLTGQTSEATLVEVDGVLFMFPRYASGYYTSENNGATWESKGSVGISYHSDCQLNAITYSRTIDGKTAILLSAPTSGRTTGKIFVGLVQDDASIKWAYTYNVNGSGTYQYSCLTELKDGSIGLLYESAAAEITYTSYDIKTIASGATIGDSGNSGETPDPDPDTPVDGETITEDITVYVGGTYTGTYNIGGYGPVNDTSNEYYNVSYDKVTVEGKSGYQPVDAKDITSGESYYISDGTNYLQLTTGTDWRGNTTYTYNNKTNPSEATKWTFEAQSSGGYKIKDSSGNYLRYTTNAGLTGTSRSNNASTWYVGANGGIYCSATNWSGTTNTYYLTSGTSWSASTTANTSVKVYSTTPVTEPGRTDTKITFTGKVPTTEPQVFKLGTGTFNVTVKEDPGYVTPKTTPVVGGSDNTNAGAGKVITKLTIGAGLSYDLDIASDYSDATVEWKIADTSIATVDQYGNVTAVKDGETELLVTVNGTTYKIPVVVKTYVDTSSTTSTKVLKYYVNEKTNSTAYYGLLYGSTNSTVAATDLVEIQEGEVIYFSFPSTYAAAMDFFASPYEGYALTRLDAQGNNIAGNYMALNSSDPASTDFITTPSAAGASQVTNFGSTVVYELVQKALDTIPKCDGGMGFTRPRTNGDDSIAEVTFRSEKLPTVTKEVYTVDGKPYTPGMLADANVDVVFKITVTQYAAQDAIEYTHETLTDKLEIVDKETGKRTPGTATFENDSNETTPTLSDTALDEDTVTEYLVTYRVQKADLEKVLENTVTLSYSYKSKYSSGTFGASADAKAELTLTDFKGFPDIVIDFALPVAKYHTQPWATEYDDEIRVDTDPKKTYAEKGTVEVSGTNLTGLDVTYTPPQHTMEYEIDTVHVTSTRGIEFTFRVIPASTVYYEDSFVTFTQEDLANNIVGWTRVYDEGTNENTPTTSQALDQLGGKDANIYGYDTAYGKCTKFSMGSAMKTTVSGSQYATATFTFKGTGFDIISLTSNTTGTIVVTVTGENNYEKNYIVDTYYGYSYDEASKTWVVDKTRSDTLYQIPVMKVTVPYGTYTATVTAAYNEVFDHDGTNSYDFYLDAVRIYNPLGDNGNQYYTEDGEGYAQYIKIRDQLITNGAFNSSSTGAVFIDGKDKADIAEYTSYGPNNEVYLLPNQTIAFTLTGDLASVEEVHIGAKAPMGSAVLNVSAGDKATPIETATEMYYDITTCAINNGEAKLVTITNTDGNDTMILSLTNLKVTYKESGKSVSLSITKAQAEEAAAMVRAMYAPAPVEPETFEPERFDVSWNRSTVKVGQKATLTVKTSEDVEAITVDGVTVDSYRTRTERTGWGRNAKKVTYREFTYTVTAAEAGTLDISVAAVNAEGVSSAAVTATVTVQAASQRPGIGGWLDKIFSRWF